MTIHPHDCSLKLEWLMCKEGKKTFYVMYIKEGQGTLERYTNWQRRGYRGNNWRKKTIAHENQFKKLSNTHLTKTDSYILLCPWILCRLPVCWHLCKNHLYICYICLWKMLTEFWLVNPNYNHMHVITLIGLLIHSYFNLTKL